MGPKDVDFLVENYDSSVAMITKILKKTKRAKIKKNKKEVMEYVQEFLDSYNFLMTGEKKTPKQDITDVYNLSYLKCDYDPERLLKDLRVYIDKKEKNELGADVKGVNALLQGEAGLGKTALVQYIAKTLGKKLLKKPASELLSMWVGGCHAKGQGILMYNGTIKKVEAFREAELMGTDSKPREVLTFGRGRTNPMSLFLSKENLLRSMRIIY